MTNISHFDNISQNIKGGILIQNILSLDWRSKQSIAFMATLSLLMAITTGLLAQIKLYLPWSPVPITGQTFAVLLAGVILGKNWGGISQILYVVLGLTGFSWFAEGYNALFGPTGGYIIGFILAAWFIGYISDTYIKSRDFIPMILLMSFANLIIYGCGLLQLGLWMHLVSGTGVSLKELLFIGAVPFMLGDIIKIIIASTIAKSIAHKEI